jgi:hypothetical protein
MTRGESAHDPWTQVGELPARARDGTFFRGLTSYGLAGTP